MEADPNELLAWLKGDGSSERDLQMIALEQLCMLVLMSDNIDRCFEQYKPQLFLPALCDIFNDPLVPTHILEVTARALTYFLDVSVDCAKKITSHSTVIHAMCNCLQVVDIEDRTNKDLAEQIIKVFERLCLRETSSIYEQDGLRYVLEFINNCYSVIHKDSLQSALNVVVKLIGKIDPQNSSALDQTIESLSNLLLHDDPFVADNALRCFATLADRFSRKNVDPEPLMRYCLKDVLLRSLHHVSKSSTDSSGTHTASNIRGITTNLSVVTGLLSTLCRGSVKVTYDLLRSDLPDALESALCSGDERCVLDTMRFLDLLIVLLFEGRQTLTRPGNTLRTTNTLNPAGDASQPASSLATIYTVPSDRSQQQIIEYIRSRDVQAFISYIEENNIDINYTDHVGQTMLNWVAAFGTREMVEYLCRRGADVNRGQRSSSLHYAACFGRPSIARLLLKYGANVELRDEDGRTALDKARERQDESHQEVIDILQSTNEWNDTKQASKTIPNTEQTKDNIEVQLIYLERLLSIFCQLYQNTMILTIKRSTLRLISKLLQYATIEQIRQLKILTTLFELLSTVLNTNEDDDDTSNLVLLIIKNLFEKDRHLFLEQFQYLGLISKITTLAMSHESKNENSQQLLTINIVPIDTKDMLCSRPYVWNEYNFLRNRECLYVWNNSLIIELSMGSNGWFRYFANNSLSTMYSSGSPETNIDTDENRHEFIEKFQRLKQEVLEGGEQEKDKEKQNVIIARTIFTSDTTSEKIITIGNWTLQCDGPTQLRIHNIEGEQVTILEHGETGFIFESNRRTRHKHKADTPLNNEFSVPWPTIETLTSTNNSTTVTLNKNKQDQTKQRASEIASFIYNEHLKTFSPTNYTRSILTEFQLLVNDLNNELNLNSFDNLKNLFEKLKNFLIEKTDLSIYELSSSGLVSVLLKVFHDLSSNDQAKERAKLFCSIFLSDEQPQAFQVLIRKLISILESIEKLPLFLYDAPFNYSLQIFSKRFRFQIQYKNEQQLFTDRTGKSLKIEPLTTVGQVKTFLASMASKQWYDYLHGHLEFVKQLKSDIRPIFTYTSDFDQNGILYWIGTNGKTASNYTNPCSTGLISGINRILLLNILKRIDLVILVNCSDNNYSSQQLSDLVSHTLSIDDQDDNEDTIRSFSWILIDLGLLIIPTHFTLRHATGGSNSWTKTVLFQISKDAVQFTPCDASVVNETNSPTATWTVKNLSENSSGFRYIRIHQKSSRYPICISGFEVYGQVHSAIDIRSKPELNRSRSTRDDIRNRSINSRQTPSYHHSHSTSSTMSRATKMQSHILRRLASMNTSSFSNRSPDSTSENHSEQSTINQILFDLSSIPTDLSNAIESNDPERLRLVIEEALTRLTGDKTLNDNSNLINLISQRKSVSTPDISNDETIFSVSSTEQASSADNLFPSSDSTDHIDDLMEGFSDQISQQYEVLVEESLMEPKISLDSLISSEQSLTPTPSNTDNRLGIHEVINETILISKDEANSTNATTELIPTISSTTESESRRAVTEENNKKNATNECSDQQIIFRIENDVNSNAANILTTPTESSSNLMQTTAINITDIPSIDDETIRIEDSTNLSDQQQKQNDETTTDDDDDEHTLLKCLKLTNEQIEAPVEEEDEDDDDEEDQQEEEEYNEELQEQLHGQQQEITHRNWDEDFVLKRQFSVLLPAFDGRPGRTNINATQDLAVPTTMTPKEETLTKRRSDSDALTAANMTLYIRGPSPSAPGIKDIDIEMSDTDATIFKYIQKLINPFPSLQRIDRIKRIFEPTYTIVYTEKLNERPTSTTNDLCDENLFDSSNDPEDICTIKDILKLLRQLYYLSTNYIHTNPHFNEAFSIDNYFYSKKLNNKLLQQIQDSILIASSSLPSWTSWLIHSYKFLYPFETRQLYFRTTSFGTSRSIVWLQERREELVRTLRNSNHSRPRLSNENPLHEFRFGRLKIDRAVAIDRENVLRDAMNLFHYHAKLKSKLEIQFQNEEGTGDGPTLEFYALIATELQKHSLGLWWNHDDYDHQQTDYVRKLEGLFPAPYQQDHKKLDDVCNYFSLVGIYFAKCLLDKYLIDMPLSISFLKLLCMKTKSDDIWYDGILDVNDLIMIEPSRGNFFKQLFQLIEKRNKILNDENKTDEEKNIQCHLLRIENDLHEPVDIEHLCLTFVYSPPSNTYEYQSVELIPNGSHTDVTIDNIDQYINLSLQFILRDGIRRQMDAFRNGFNQVFSIHHLQCFNPSELQLVLCGNQWPSWTLDDLLTHIEPSHGFTRESAGFTKFLNVMLALDGLERKSVVQFITGCSSLPPGGLANLRPRLSVARKVEADDNSYPSVNTCYHYLKLPDYSSEDILKLRLMTACKERGFYFN
ncbi:unnamed protein product [Rotaria socialis]|uniref:E3 ubiquitin-protein ligase n=1 Tax=Rotaria socialis TaxID=392032 RepID=A0A817V500_9BILA|nr:unnamed protein product [Rotaria socialis]